MHVLSKGMTQQISNPQKSWTKKRERKKEVYSPIKSRQQPKNTTLDTNQEPTQLLPQMKKKKQRKKFKAHLVHPISWKNNWFFFLFGKKLRTNAIKLWGTLIHELVASLLCRSFTLSMMRNHSLVLLRKWVLFCSMLAAVKSYFLLLNCESNVTHTVLYCTPSCIWYCRQEKEGHTSSHCIPQNPFFWEFLEMQKILARKIRMYNCNNQTPQHPVFGIFSLKKLCSFYAVWCSTFIPPPDFVALATPLGHSWQKGQNYFEKKKNIGSTKKWRKRCSGMP